MANVPEKKEVKTTALMACGSAQGGLIPGNFEGMWRLATIMSASGLMPKGVQSVEAVFVAIQMGMEVGLSPMQSVQNIAVINGRPSLWGDSVLALVRASGLLEDFSETIEGEWGKDNCTAICKARRKGQDQEIIRSFSIGEAKTAGLWNGGAVWPKYPRRMLQMRARSFCLRDGFGDVLKGLRMAEEVMDFDMDLALQGDGSYSTQKTSVKDAPESSIIVFDAMIQDRLKGHDATLEDVNAFVLKSAEYYKKTTDDIKAEAASNMDKFFAAFEKWCAKRRQADPPQATSPAPSNPFEDQGRWFKLKEAGLSTFFYTNQEAWNAAKDVSKAAFRAKWARIYPDTLFPTDTKATVEANPYCPGSDTEPDAITCAQCCVEDCGERK